MSASQQAAELRAQADALDAQAVLEAELLVAKEAFAADPTAETRAAKQAAAVALRNARQAARVGRSGLVGGDAVIAYGTEA